MKVRIESVESPFDDPEVAGSASRLLARAEAMGLLPGDAVVTRLDNVTFHWVASQIARADVGTRHVVEALAGVSTSAARLRETLERITDSLEQSPVPSTEWAHVSEILGDDLLSELLNVSASSIRRYRSGERTTPDPLATRLHFLALLISDLAGAYNEFGIRNWFRRPRATLEGRSPTEVLAGDWTPEDSAAGAVRVLAESLTASPAT